MTAEQVGGVARALLSAAGGFLVGQGLIDSATATTIAGAAATIITAIWSVKAKKADKPA